MPLPEPIFLQAFKCWKNNELDKNLKEEALKILEPCVDQVIKNTTYTLKEKEQLKEKTNEIYSIIDKHFNVISTKKILD
jgi:hypothetical protein